MKDEEKEESHLWGFFKMERNDSLFFYILFYSPADFFLFISLEVI